MANRQRRKALEEYGEKLEKELLNAKIKRLKNRVSLHVIVGKAIFFSIASLVAAFFIWRLWGISTYCVMEKIYFILLASVVLLLDALLVGIFVGKWGRQ